MAELRVTNTGTIKLFESDDTSSVTIASPASLGGDRTITLPDANVDLTEVNTMPIANLDIDGGTDIGANIADSDLLIIDDGAGGTNRKTAASRLKTYVGAGAGAFDIANLDIDGGTDIGADIADSDLFIIDDGAGGTNRKVAASRIATYAGGGFTLLTSLNGSGVTHASASVDNIFTSTYDIYRMVGFMAPSQSAEARIKLRSGGSDVSDGNYNWVNMASYVPDSASTTTDVLHSNHADDVWEFGSADISSDNDSDVVAFDFTLHDPNTNMLSRTYMTGHSVFRNGGSAKLYSELFGGGRESNPNADGIKFFFSGGTMRYYRINIYGAKQS